jgi:hypothetical protein
MQVGRKSSTTTHGSHNGRNGARKGASLNHTATTPDFRFENHFSVCFLHPLTDTARAWVDEHIGQDNGYQPQYPSVLLEPRYCSDVLIGLQRDGLTVRRG